MSLNTKKCPKELNYCWKKLSFLVISVIANFTTAIFVFLFLLPYTNLITISICFFFTSVFPHFHLRSPVWLQMSMCCFFFSASVPRLESRVSIAARPKVNARGHGISEFYIFRCGIPSVAISCQQVGKTQGSCVPHHNFCFHPSW